MEKLPKGYLTTDAASPSWDVGYMFVWSPPFAAWLQHNGRYTIRPGETGKQAVERVGETIPPRGALLRLEW